MLACPAVPDTRKSSSSSTAVNPYGYSILTDSARIPTVPPVKNCTNPTKSWKQSIEERRSAILGKSFFTSVPRSSRYATVISPSIRIPKRLLGCGRTRKRRTFHIRKITAITSTLLNGDTLDFRLTIKRGTKLNVNGVMKYPAPMSGSSLKRLLARVVSEKRDRISV